MYHSYIGADDSDDYSSADHQKRKEEREEKIREEKEKDKLSYELMLRGINLRKLTNTEILTKRDLYDNMLLRKK